MLPKAGKEFSVIQEKPDFCLDSYDNRHYCSVYYVGKKCDAALAASRLVDVRIIIIRLCRAHGEWRHKQHAAYTLGSHGPG